MIDDKFNELGLVARDSRKIELKQKQPLLRFKLVSHLLESIENENTVYHADLDAQELSLEMDDRFWIDHFIPNALHKLEKLTIFTEDNLFAFIPCLINPELATRFYLKLGTQNETIQARAQHLIKLCHSEFTDVNGYRKAVIDTLNTYPSAFKLSLFGHHHNERAIKTIAAIRLCQSIDDIKNILLRQKSILESAAEERDNTSSEEWDDQRWTLQTNLKNVPPTDNEEENSRASGFYKVICEALQLKPYFQETAQDRARCAI